MFYIRNTMLKTIDPQIYQLIKSEIQRQTQTINLIPSENYVSKAVLEALGSVLTNKYSEGYPQKRYYAGNFFIDEIERIAIERAKKLFGAEDANVQPYSGSPANLAVYAALLKPGDKIMGLELSSGGHLTHGAAVSFASKIYRFVPYNVDPKTGLLDYDQIESLAKKQKPKMIVCGATSYPRLIDFKKFAQIAHSINAYCLADISHVAGLVVAGFHPSPFPYADVVTTTTHKTLRGPRGAIIMMKSVLSDKINKSVFPGLQGGPHNHQTAAIAVCLKEAQKPEFKTYVGQLLKNSLALTKELQKQGFVLVSGGTDNHLALVDLRNLKLSGEKAQWLLEKIGIIVNKNVIPDEPRSNWETSGIRLGTPAVTTRKMKESQMAAIAKIISGVLKNPQDEKVHRSAKKEVSEIAQSFPIPSFSTL